MATRKPNLYVATAVEPVVGKPQFSHAWRAVTAAWARWMNPACPTCGMEKSCPECLIENNA